MNGMKHVMLDLYQCPPEVLTDEAFLRQVLNDFPARIGMEKAGPVELRDVQATSDPLDAGLSGFVIIMTSHISLHAWGPYRMVNIDVFSCEDFETEDAVQFATTRFQTEDVEVNTIERAIRSPRVSRRKPVQSASNPMLRGHREGRIPFTPPGLPQF